MLNQRSVDEVASSRFGRSFQRPLYDSYCFNRVPGTIAQLLGCPDFSPQLPEDTWKPLGDTFNNVVLLFIDGFGWRFVEQFKESFPFLERCFTDGVVSKLTSQFPSTTACQVTTCHTGLPVCSTGIYEWHYYEPLIDAMISPLLYSLSGVKQREMLAGLIDPEKLFPFPTIYNYLGGRGVGSTAFLLGKYSGGSYRRATMSGSTIIPYTAIGDGVSLLAESLKTKREGRHYYHFYYDMFDSANHHYGPLSKQVEDEGRRIFDQLHSVLLEGLRGLDSTLLILVADHGHVEIDPRTTIYLNEAFPHLKNFIKRNSKGALLAPAGSPRDFFLHVRGEDLANIYEELKGLLEGKAEVHRTEDFVRDGMFGPCEDSKRLLERVGEIVILPLRGESVFWRDKFFENRAHGHHGGLTAEELEIPFAAITL